MKPSSILILAFCIASLWGCADDPESPSNVPPDLKLEDVVGCWYYKSEGGFCVQRCYDRRMLQWDQFIDSTPYDLFETIGTYSIKNFEITQKVVWASTSAGRSDDTMTLVGRYRREGGYLYELDTQHKEMNRYIFVVNNDSLPCGKAFTLFAKPANWSLF